MKKIHLLAAFCLIMSTLGCSQKKSAEMSSQRSENSYPTAEAALEAAKTNLPAILNQAQKRSYGLESDEQIRNLATTHDLQLVLLAMNQLRDSVIRTAADARIYALGQGARPNICISVNKAENNWVISTVGMKKYVDAIGEEPDVTAIVEALGLELSFLEVQAEGEKGYRPIVDYPEAELVAQNTYSAPVLLQALERYRAALERQFGDAFSAGELDR
jgi:hypothetical protein